MNILPNMKVGGKVNMGLRADRSALAGLNNPTLWGAGKISNYANMSKITIELLDLWDAENPADLVEYR